MSTIRITHPDPTQASPSTDPIFAGPVSIQQIVNDSSADLLRVTAVTFADGARNRPHRHAADQVLIATSGSGFVASDDSTYPLTPGAIAFIPKNTRHWHGANPGATFTHLSILTPGQLTIEGDG